MAVNQRESKRKPSGGLLKRIHRRKTKANLGRAPSHTKVGEIRLEMARIRNGSLKTRLHQSNIANLLDPKTKKYTKAKITSVADNPASRHFVRQNVITKGAIIETEKGKARVTSRPGQHGAINAVLV
jgi:small subunit ribosomal protein S8e